MSAANARGSARVSRANASPARTFGVAPKRTFPATIDPGIVMHTTKACDGEDAIANTRDARATQSPEYARDR